MIFSWEFPGEVREKTEDVRVRGQQGYATIFLRDDQKM
jgi:hypothetical protein